jgi:Fur family transcriptional regulator, ferric uptake regulator
MSQATAEQLLRDRGLRCTSTRVRVLQTLLRARRPLSHQDVMGRLKGAGLDRVTVYRTLHALVEADLVHEVFVNERTSLYESSERCHIDHCHAHFTCRKCGGTTCLTDVRVPLLEGLGQGFVAERQKVLIEGLCPSCSLPVGKRPTKGAPSR